MTEVKIPPSDQPWWNTFFDNLYAEYGFALSDPGVIEQSADFLMEMLRLAPGGTVFDQCCGVGRISIPLAERRANVVGVDFTESYVRSAQRLADERGLPCAFHHADAHEFVAPQPCDAAFNWYTSFGYDEDDEHNLQVLKRAYDSLKPGGRFALDFLNVPNVLSDFKPMKIDRPSEDEPDSLIVLHETETDLPAGMLRSKWTFLLPDKKRVTRRVEVRMYMPHEIAAMLRRCGFRDLRFFGWVDQSPLQQTSRRCIAVASKPDSKPGP